MTWYVPVDNCPLHLPLSLSWMTFHHPKDLTAISWILVEMTRLANMFPLNPYLGVRRLQPNAAKLRKPCRTLTTWSSPARAPCTRLRLPRNRKTKPTVRIQTPTMMTAPWPRRKVLRMLHRNTPHFNVSTGLPRFPRAAKTKAAILSCTHTLTQHSCTPKLIPHTCTH